LADSGQIPVFPGVSTPYEPPVKPDLVLHTDRQPVNECVDAILNLLEQRSVFQ
jgi:adenylylsulfate kinase